jgi:cytochrome c oxidase subunit 2
MVIAVVIVLLVIGTVLFHFLSPWWFTPIASNWGMIDTTVNITFWVTGIVFIVVNLFLAYVVVKYRHQKDQRAHYEPENKKLESWLTVVTAIGVALMLAPGLFVWAQIVNVPDDAAEVEAVGQQWHWSFRYPGADGTFGQVEQALISRENPFGVMPDDPAGQDDVLVASPFLHLPVDKPVKLLLRSKDVLHDFAVAEFRLKMDLVPGMVTYFWLTPTRTGEFDILCEELCGIGHHTMQARVVVESEADFNTWLATQPTFAETQATPAGDPVTGQALYAVCSACHGSEGEGNKAVNAPKLAGQERTYLERQLINYKSGVRGSGEGDTLGQQMAGMAATLADEKAVRDVVAYINTLPDNRPETTVTGNAENGKDFYTTCQYCHGPEGQGYWTMNAPRLSGMDDWYMAEQLRKFRDGVRGSHPRDMYGRQMAMMADLFQDEQTVADLVAYLNELQSEE